ncbi:DUF1372 family protein [Streptococcus merionis]|uniref:DUF1372 family protein n=1 Tax=Streptococcus merionis TaxID=400065 RepID=UPI00351463DE
MRKRQFLPMLLSILVLSLSMFNAGLIVSKNYYKPKLEVLENKVSKLEDSDPVIIYQVDNAGGSMDEVGKITDKEIIEGRYTVTIGAYGKFMVTKQHYDSLSVGDDIPEYLKQKGATSNE